MEQLNQKINLEIEVLTPLSIGAGADKDWVRGIDFVVANDGKLYKLNMRKMLKVGVNPTDLSTYFAKKDEEGIINKLAGHLEEVSDNVIPMPVQSDNDVKAMLKNQLTGNPIIAGSSLKGAIRSVLFQYLGGTSKDGKEVFGTSKDGDEFMRFIKLSDAEFEGTALVNTKIFNLQMTGSGRGGWKHGAQQTDSHFRPTGFNTLYECLMPTQKSYASLMMTETLFDLYELNVKTHIKSSQKKPVLHDVLTLFSIINKHTKEYLEKERAFFCQYETEKTADVVRSIDALIEQMPQDNSYCILKMSVGSGFHSITGDWQLDDYSIDGVDSSGRVSRGMLHGKKSAKSRKIAIWDGHFSLMGFVKLTTLSEEAMREIEAQRIAEKERKEQEEQARLEEKRKKAEAVARAQREREERERQFLELVSEVEQMVAAEHYEEALTKYDAACAAYPECKQNRVDIEELRWKVDAIVTERKQKEDEAKREQERLQIQKEKAEGGLALLLNEKYEFGPNEGQYKVTSFKVCLNKIVSWMKAAGVTQIPVDQQDALLEILKRLKTTADKKEAKSWDDFNSGIWKQLVSLFGPETAKQWFEEIVVQ